MATFKEGAIMVLRDVQNPLSPADITRIGLEKGYIGSETTSPEKVMSSVLHEDITRFGKGSPFVEQEPGLFGLWEWEEDTEGPEHGRPALDPFQSPMWEGLMRWILSERGFGRRNVEHTDAQRRIRELLAEDRLRSLTVQEFDENVFRFGSVLDSAGDTVPPAEAEELTGEEMQQKLDSGEWKLTGNRSVGQTVHSYEVYLRSKSDEEKQQIMRSALQELLYEGEDRFAAFERVDKGNNGLGRNTSSLILCMLWPENFGIWNEKSGGGMARLAWLLGIEEEWPHVNGDYASFNAVLVELLSNSQGALEDLLQLDTLLYELSELGEVEFWKVAIALDNKKQRDELIRRCKEDGFAAIGWPPEEYGETNDNVKRFKEIKAGDYVVMHVPGKIGAVGRVTRPYYEIDRNTEDEIDAHYRRRIDVDWLVGERDYGKLLSGKVRGTVAEVDEGVFWELAAKYAGEPGLLKILNPPPDVRERLAGRGEGDGKEGPTAAEVAAACYTTVAKIEEIIGQLRRKKQMIFYGPPGTGKTFVALKLAKYLTEGNDTRQQLIQFHPSYTYEDFMQGIKPESVKTEDGTYSVSYPVEDGVFKRFCDDAAKQPGKTFVFVIDEINRGNIAKIFGELMFLLEYRGEEIELAYAEGDGGEEKQRFSIPGNVLIIGTMNTADRSIALVDFALRRRFAFYPFYPDDDFCEPVLGKWLDENRPEMGHVAAVVKEFNKKVIGKFGRDMAVGHSHFMEKDLNEDRLKQIWQFQIMPLIEEYLHLEPKRREEFELDAFRRDNAETGETPVLPTATGEVEEAAEVDAEETEDGDE